MTGQEIENQLLGFVTNPATPASDGKLQVAELAELLKNMHTSLSGHNTDVIVVSTNGNYGTPTSRSFHTPFTDLLSAKYAAENEGIKTIFVFGNHTVQLAEGETLMLDGLHWVFFNSTITHTGTPLFFDSVGMKTTVSGNARFISDGILIRIEHENSVLNLECESIEMTGASSTVLDFYNAPLKALKIKTDSIISSKFIFGKGSDSAGGDRKDKTRGFIDIQCRYMETNAMWDEFTGWKNYDINIHVHTRKGKTVDEGGIDFGYGMENCTVNFEAVNWEGRYFMDLSGGVKDSTLYIQFKNGYSNSQSSYGLQIACNHEKMENSNIYIRNTKLTMGTAPTRGCLNIGNHGGQVQKPDFKVYVENCTFIVENAQGSPISMGGNNHIFVKNSHLKRYDGGYPAVVKGESGVADGTPKLYNGGGLCGNGASISPQITTYGDPYFIIFNY